MSRVEADRLSERMGELGERLRDREREHRGGLEAARSCAEGLREIVAAGIDSFHRAQGETPVVEIALGEVRVDDKHLRAIQFDLRRGRHTGIVTVKSRGEVTLVGPFRAGKVEGPCKSFPSDSLAEIERALGDFLESFVEEAATP